MLENMTTESFYGVQLRDFEILRREGSPFLHGSPFPSSPSLVGISNNLLKIDFIALARGLLPGPALPQTGVILRLDVNALEFS